MTELNEVTEVETLNSVHAECQELAIRLCERGVPADLALKGMFDATLAMIAETFAPSVAIQYAREAADFVERFPASKDLETFKLISNMPTKGSA